MRRSLPAAIVVLLGLLLVVDFVVINPTVAGAADFVLRLLVLLAAAAALAGAAALVLRHWTDLVERRGEPLGSLVLLLGFTLMMVAGFYPGSGGASDPAVRWLVAALLAPLVASLFALLFFFLLAAMSVIVLLLPVGGALGDGLAGAAGWAMAVPIGGVFRGLLIGIGIVTAVHAARVLLAVDGADE